jgi:hypothetical protein
LIRHIFSAEKRYIDRLSNRPLTDTSSIPNNSIEALFQFGRQSRADLKAFVESCPAQDWDIPQDFQSDEQFSESHTQKTCCPRPDP